MLIVSAHTYYHANLRSISSIELPASNKKKMMGKLAIAIALPGLNVVQHMSLFYFQFDGSFFSTYSLRLAQK